MGVDPMEQPEAVGDLKVAPVLDEKERAERALPPPAADRFAAAAETREDYPTPEEIQALRRVSAHIPPGVFAVAFIELCERFSYYGIVNILTNYIQYPLPAGSSTGAPLDPWSDDAQPGALGMGQRASTGISTFIQFWQYLLPLFGAYIADEHWGRYRTIGAALAIDIVGHLVLITSALPGVIDRPRDSLAALIIGLVVMGFGTGGFKPNISPLIVEQIDLGHMRVKTLKSGERVIVDSAVTISRVYNWFYFFINTGSLVGSLGMSYAERYVGFWLSFVLPTAMLCICPAMLLWGRKRYDTHVPSGSVLKPAFRTWFLAQRGRWSVNPYRTWRNMHDGTFWDRVKPSRFTDETRPEWMTFDDGWVDELRRGFAACAVFCYYPFYWLTYNMINNNLISQAAVMEKHGVPNDVIQNLDPLALLIFIPFVDFFFYPFLRRVGIKFTPIKRIACGFYMGVAAMIWSAVTQLYVYRTSECGYNASGTRPDPATGRMVPCAPAPLNVWIQTGPFVLVALSEILASITSLEYAYSKAPRSMRSMVQAVALFTTSFSAAIGQGLTALSQDPLLVWNYGVAGIVAFVAGTLFWLQFRGLDEEEDALNELPEGRIWNNRRGGERGGEKGGERGGELGRRDDGRTAKAG